MYNIRILEEASRELARLDKPVGRRIVERINFTLLCCSLSALFPVTPVSFFRISTCRPCPNPLPR